MKDYDFVSTGRTPVARLACGCEIFEAHEPDGGAYPEIEHCEKHTRSTNEGTLNGRPCWFDDAPIGYWFELSYANFLTLPRLVMESMPLQWQRTMARLLHEVDDTFDWRPESGRYMVTYKRADGKYSEPPLSDYRRGSVEHLRIAKDGTEQGGGSIV